MEIASGLMSKSSRTGEQKHPAFYQDAPGGVKLPQNNVHSCLKPPGRRPAARDGPPVVPHLVTGIAYGIRRTFSHAAPAEVIRSSAPVTDVPDARPVELQD